MKLYSFGDSHSIVFEKSTHTTQNFWFGGWTMHRFGRDFLNLTDIHCSPIDYRHYSIPNDGILLSSFGEIDVRNHIHEKKLKHDKRKYYLHNKYKWIIQRNQSKN
jgi:hypothetical protein